MKRGLRKWWVDLKWQERRSANRQDQINAFKSAVETLEKNFNVKIGSDIFQGLYILDKKSKKSYDWRSGDIAKEML